ncbi:hypothetical protein [Cohnella sp. 56]|uniref:hypothetical protein n=1 Tax=Cohnella sp. 56 TaxID=3113722 RepID=UPI0030EA7602
MEGGKQLNRKFGKAALLRDRRAAFLSAPASTKTQRGISVYEPIEKRMDGFLCGTACMRFLFGGGAAFRIGR